MDENAYENEIAALECKIDDLKDFVRTVQKLIETNGRWVGGCFYYGCILAPEFVSLQRDAKKLL